MKYVLDASVALKWVFTTETGADVAARLRDDFKKQIHELLVPETFPVEIAHALTRAERRGIIQKGKAWVLFSEIFTPSPDTHPYINLLPRAVELSSQVRHGVFDCLYVALAEREQCEVVTADQRIVAAFPSLAVSLDSL